MSDRNLYATPQTATSERIFTLAETIYNVCVALAAVFFLISALSMIFIVIPQMGDESGLFKGMAAVGIVFAIALSFTLFANIRSGTMKTLPTIIQIVVFVLFVYFIPLAIWAGILLVLRHRKTRTHEDRSS